MYLSLTASTHGHSSPDLLYTEPEQEYNLIGLCPTIEVPQEPQSIDTTIGPISLNFNQSCLEPDQIPQNVRQSIRSLPDESQLPPPEGQSSMMKKNVLPEKKQAVKKYVCPEPDCPKSYTQSHNLKAHRKKHH